jgi:flagellar basal-body rod protein FlgC
VADSLNKIMSSAASGMSAQTIRMNTIASNLANAGTIGGSDAATYHAKYPVFSEVVAQAGDDGSSIKVTGIKHSDKPLENATTLIILNGMKTVLCI